MTIDFTQIIIAVIGLVISVISGLVTKYVVPWLKQRNLETFAAQLVRLAFSIFKDGEGKKKFDYVVNQIEEKYGKWFSAEEIVSAVQSAYVDFSLDRGVEPSPANLPPVDKE